MDSNEITISYQDEIGAWDFISSLFQAQFPIKEIDIMLNFEQQTIKNLKVGFFNHSDEFFKRNDTTIFNYRNPLVYLLIIGCKSKENYNESIKPLIQKFISEHDNVHEWLIIYTNTEMITNDE